MPCTHERVDKASDKTFNKAYAEDKQSELNKKAKETGQAPGKYVISLYLTRISQEVKIRDV